MTTYQGESFMRASTRAPLDKTTLPPFNQKVSKVPTLTSGLLTMSPNTTNEEIMEYNGVDAVNLTITIVKRGIKWSSQILTTNGNGTATGDYNNSDYTRSHSQGDEINGDITHLHIIQDNASKLEKTGGLRDGLTANAIMKTNGSGVESAETVDVISSILSTDNILIDRGGDFKEVAFSVIQGNIGSNIQETNFESIITLGDIIGQLPDGIYKVQSENKTSTALGGSRTYKDHCLVSTGVYFVVFEDLGTLYGVVMSLSSSDVATWGTPVNIGTASSPTAKCALINTNKIVVTYSPTASVNAISIIATISGTSVSFGTALTEVQSGNCSIQSVCKVRTDVYAYCFGVNTNPSGIKVNTVSGTTITAGTVLATFTFTGFSQNGVYACYLSDNYIGFIEAGIVTSGIGNVKIYNITGGGTTVANTYTSTISGLLTGGGASSTCYLSKYSDTEVIITNQTTTEKSIFTIPGAGTVLVKTTLTANGAVNYPTIPLFTGIYGIHTGSSLLVYQRDILIGTITGVSAFASNGVIYNNGRFLTGFTLATLVPNIVNLASIFRIGVAIDALGKFTPGRNNFVVSGIIKGYRYYLQSNGTISNGIGITNTVTMVNFIGRGLLTDKIMIEI